MVRVREPARQRAGTCILLRHRVLHRHIRAGQHRGQRAKTASERHSSDFPTTILLPHFQTFTIFAISPGTGAFYRTVFVFFSKKTSIIVGQHRGDCAMWRGPAKRTEGQLRGTIWYRIVLSGHSQCCHLHCRVHAALLRRTTTMPLRVQRHGVFHGKECGGF